MDQLVLPKVQKAIADWSPKRSEGTLHSLVFPWLPHVGLRLEVLVGDARRKVKNLFRSWSSDQGVPEHLMIWQKVGRMTINVGLDGTNGVQRIQVFEKREWEDVLLKYVVPKLGATMRDDFKIDPRSQVMEPLLWVLAWVPHLRTSIFAQILETEFFPKWLAILHRWLATPNAKLDEVEEWCVKFSFLTSFNIANKRTRFPLQVQGLEVGVPREPPFESAHHTWLYHRLAVDSQCTEPGPQEPAYAQETRI